MYYNQFFLCKKLCKTNRVFVIFMIMVNLLSFKITISSNFISKIVNIFLKNYYLLKIKHLNNYKGEKENLVPLIGSWLKGKRSYVLCMDSILMWHDDRKKNKATFF